VAVWWREAAIVAQGVMHALNPVRRVDIQIAEAIHLHARSRRGRTHPWPPAPGVEHVEANPSHTPRW
jgi:ABC-type dipeptide/oligopeptide/nickel transport system ATPase component